MKRLPSLLLLGAVLLTAGASARAESLSAPFGSSAPVMGSNPLAEPGFNSDVERSLSDLTRLQCSMLSVLLLSPKPCSTP